MFMQMRLNHFIAKSGCASRRKADVLIQQGKVEVNGEAVREPFYRVNEGDTVKVCGKRVDITGYVYIAFNKPEGVTTTLQDRFADKKVTDFLPDKFKGVFPVGRLDKNSSGLLILTNDGDICYRLTHPRFGVEKEYMVIVSGRLQSGDCRKALHGVISEGEHLKVKQIRLLKCDKRSTLCGVIVCEGKKRHIRRLFDSLGFPVLELKRVRICSLILGDLKEGEYRIIKKEEIGLR